MLQLALIHTVRSISQSHFLSLESSLTLEAGTLGAAVAELVVLLPLLGRGWEVDCSLPVLLLSLPPSPSSSVSYTHLTLPTNAEV